MPSKHAKVQYGVPYTLAYKVFESVCIFEKHIVTIGPPYFGATQKNCTQWTQWEKVYAMMEEG